jgi:hypothetical protein
MSRLRRNTSPTALVAALLLTLGAPAIVVPAAEPSASMAHARREDLIGTWRLVRIDILEAGRSRSDPFYGAHCSGLLIYEASGSMSVQISGQPRPRLPTPAVRGPGVVQDEQIAARLLATYYAYFGTWEYDEPEGRVTHHVAGSLYPDETGLNYTQEVALDADRLTFTVRHRDATGESLHRKVWERVHAAP